MADCRIVNASVENAVSEIIKISKQYKTDGDAFMAALNEAISPMEGETKDAFNNFFSKMVQPFITEGVPKAVESTSTLLDENRKNFINVDSQIAESINSGTQ